MGRFDLSDEEWEVIAPLLPGGDGVMRRGRPPRETRRVLDGIFYILRTGAPWRDLPERYGPWVHRSLRSGGQAVGHFGLVQRLALLVALDPLLRGLEAAIVRVFPPLWRRAAGGAGR